MKIISLIPIKRNGYDCSVQAISRLLNISYRQCYEELLKENRSVYKKAGYRRLPRDISKRGVASKAVKIYYQRKGLEYRFISGKTIQSKEIPKNCIVDFRTIKRSSGHVACLKDNKWFDSIGCFEKYHNIPLVGYYSKKELKGGTIV